MRARVLLLALSGVRIADPELHALGLGLAGFAERADAIARLPSLGLLMLAACTPERWEVEYRELDAVPDGAADLIAEEGFQLVAISALTARVSEAYRLSDALRARGVRTVLGGLHASALPDEAGDHADAVVIGEAEACWPRLLADLGCGLLQPRYRATREGADAAWAAAPPPRFDLIPASRHARVTVQTQRGCPLDCRFCGASRTIAPYRRKDADRLRAELDALAAVAGAQRLELADDNTFADPRHGLQVARLLGEHGAPWFTETDLSMADHPELVDAVADSGCAGLLVGVESASPGILRSIDSRGTKARLSRRATERVALLQERGIPVTACFVVGFDDDDEGVFERTFDAARALDACQVQVTVLTPFPGTPLYRELRGQGRLPERPAWERYTLFDPCHDPRGMSAAELGAGLRNLVAALHSPGETERRRRRYRGVVRSGGAAEGD